MLISYLDLSCHKLIFQTNLANDALEHFAKLGVAGPFRRELYEGWEQVAKSSFPTLWHLVGKLCGFLRPLFG